MSRRRENRNLLKTKVMEEELCAYKIDIERYFKRIGYKGERSPCLENLFQIHFAHAKSIPFENLDVLLGKTISLEIQDIEKKLVRDLRGGYCFEQNTLFAHVLSQLGFSFIKLAARVHYKTTKLLPKTHMSLLVQCDGAMWIADVGFGGHGLLFPLLLEDSHETEHFGWKYRVKRFNSLWVIQLWENREWNSLYSFSLEPQEYVDYKMANYYVSTHPDSPFTRSLIVQSLSPGERKILRNKKFSLLSPHSSQLREIKDAYELIEVLNADFGLYFSPTTFFRFEEE
ncbi:Arylamine N-acetyltransferase [Methylacidiphilum infernorum V4]|uniref:Arylamine N-acetyltransferase n=2 Tax=Candidatus Methylacidiphilum infernorum TaxID=511746 RepID=B3DX50_METI4|nr:Arylamine N-acetyltransferase [Methylacidiphilum infernorum V4]